MKIFFCYSRSKSGPLADSPFFHNMSEIHIYAMHSALCPLTTFNLNLKVGSRKLCFGLILTVKHNILRRSPNSFEYDIAIKGGEIPLDMSTVSLCQHSR